jgi:toxin FitB
MKYLLDTCILSEYNAKKPNAQVIQWLDHLDHESLYVSVITVGELSRGIQLLPSSKKQADLQSWFDNQFLAIYGHNIIVLDTAIMLRWAALTSQLKRLGKTVPYVDSLIAATALHENCTLVTRNEKDFQASGISLINPWII